MDDQPIQKHPLLTLLLLSPVVAVTVWSLWSLLWMTPPPGTGAQSQTPLIQPTPSPISGRTSSQAPMSSQGLVSEVGSGFVSEGLVRGAGLVSAPGQSANLLTGLHALPDVPAREGKQATPLPLATPSRELPPAPSSGLDPAPPVTEPAVPAPSGTPAALPSPSPAPLQVTSPASPVGEGSQDGENRDEENDEENDEDRDKERDADEDEDRDDGDFHGHSGKEQDNSGKGSHNSGKGGHDDNDDD